MQILRAASIMQMLLADPADMNSGRWSVFGPGGRGAPRRCLQLPRLSFQLRFWRQAPRPKIPVAIFVG